MNSGIYMILNCATEKYYIGSAVDFDERWRLHIFALSNNKHHNRHLQAAWNKYSEEVFRFVILEFCNDLEEREQYWIDKLNACNHERGYNICSFSKNRTGVKASDETRLRLSESHKGYRASEETRKKLSEIHKGNKVNLGRKQKLEHIAKRAKSNTGKKRSEEAKQRMSVAQKGRTFSEETRVKMRLAKLGKKHTEEAKLRMRGRATSEETRQKLSLAAKKQWERNKPLDYTCDMWV